MFSKLWGSRQLPIGLDLGSSNIRMLQFAGPPDALRVRAAAHFELAPGVPAEGPEYTAVLIEALQELLKCGSFSGREVVACLPDTAVQFKSVRMPRMPADELAQAVAWEAAERFQLNGQAATFQHIVAGDVQQGEESRQEVLLIAVTDERIQSYIQAFTEVGLKALALEVTPTALARCFARTLRRDADLQAVRLVVDVGHGGSKVLMLRGSQVVFYRWIELGGKSLNKAVADAMKITAADAAKLRRQQGHGAGGEEAGDKPLFGSTRREDVAEALAAAARPVMQDLAKEIGLCLRYYGVTFRGARPDCVTLCGGEAADAQLAQTIHEQLDLPVHVAEPLTGADATAEELMIDRRGSMPEWSVAAGLAVRQAVAARAMTRGAA